MDYTYDTNHRIIASTEPLDVYISDSQMIRHIQRLCSSCTLCNIVESINTPCPVQIYEPHGIRREAVDIKYHIHCLETEAYSSILMAFIAQSDLLSWGKEGLLTELRKELNVTDGEHGEILKKINSNESIEWIREQRKRASQAQDYINANTPGRPSASLGSSTIRLKVPFTTSFYHQKNISHSQASLNSNHIYSSMPPKFNGDLLTAEFVPGSTEQSMEMLNRDFHQVPPMGRGGVLKGKYQPNQHFHPSESLKLKNRTDLIEIRSTDGVIRDVEKMLFSRKKPGPVAIERAKQTLNEQEGAILAALSKLTDLFEKDDVERHDLQKYSRRTGNDDTC